MNELLNDGLIVFVVGCHKLLLFPVAGCSGNYDNWVPVGLRRPFSAVADN
jgi:hypothetical protein